MPVNFLDENEVNSFRDAAVKAGKPADMVDQYISMKRSKTATAGAETPVPQQQGGALQTASKVGKGTRNLVEKLGLGSILNVPGMFWELDRAFKSNVLGDQSGYLDSKTGAVIENPFISQEKLQRMGDRPLAQPLGEGMRGLAWAIPAGKTGQVAHKGLNLLNQAITPQVLASGAGIGLLSGTGERLDRGDEVSLDTVTKDILVGAATGWTVDKVFKGLSLTGRALKKKAPDLMKKIFKPTNTNLGEFQKNTGQDWGERVVEKDLKNIQGKDGKGILEYFRGMYDDTLGKVDDTLAKSNKTVTKKEVLKIFDDEIANLGGFVDDTGNLTSSTVGQDEALTRIFNERKKIANLTDDVSLSVLQKNKKGMQDIASSSLNLSGGGTPTSKAFGRVQHKVRKIIEREAPEVIEMNINTQHYRLGRDALSKTLDSVAKRESGGVFSQLSRLASVGGIGGAIATGNPYFAALGLAPGVLNTASRTPQARTLTAGVGSKLGSMSMPPALKRILEQSAIRSQTGNP